MQVTNMFNLHIFSELNNLPKSILAITSAVGFPFSHRLLCISLKGPEMEYNLTIDLKITNSDW